MKKILLSALAFAFILSINSCSKTAQTDYTTGVVGVYTGTTADSTINYNGQDTNANQVVTVSKVDNNHVSVSSSSGNLDAFTASVSPSNSNDAILTIASQPSGGGTIVGVTITRTVNGLSASISGGLYTSSTKTLTTITSYTDGSNNTHINGFQGTKP